MKSSYSFLRTTLRVSLCFHGIGQGLCIAHCLNDSTVDEVFDLNSSNYLCHCPGNHTVVWSTADVKGKLLKG